MNGVLKRCSSEPGSGNLLSPSGDHSKTAMLKDTCFCGYAFAVQNKDCGDGHLMAFAAEESRMSGRVVVVPGSS